MKRIIMILLALAMVMSFVACNEGAEVTTEAPETTATPTETEAPAETTAAETEAAFTGYKVTVTDKDGNPITAIENQSVAAGKYANVPNATLVPTVEGYEFSYWADANGIAGGYGDGRFGPEDTLTREQMVAMLWRYAKYKGYDVSIGEDTNILSYGDALDISEYAVSAMQWACGSGILSGQRSAEGTVLNPTGNTTRAQLSVVLMKFDQWVKQTQVLPQ